MLKKATAHLLTRAVPNSGYVFARAYRTATVRESAPNGLFQQPVRERVGEGMDKAVGPQT
jgi:hypothetical protein